MAERLNQHTNPIIGRNLVRLRNNRNLRPTEVIQALAKRGIKVSSGAFSKIENGSNNPMVAMLKVLTEILDCDYNDFFDAAS